VKLLTGTYAQIMIIAILLAIPVAILFGNKLLQGISQRIKLNAELFIPGVLVIILLSALTIGSQTLKAAFSNPVHGLREE